MSAIRPIILSLAVLAVAVESFFLSSTSVSHDNTVAIELKGTAVYIGALGEDRKVTIKATYGLVRIQIKDRKVAVVGAECPDQICVQTGWRSLEGESIFCEPNELIIHILGK